MHERKSKTSDQITMKCLHILLTTSCLISSGLAKPTSVVAYQDSLGQYSFGYTSPNSARAEIRKLNGEVQGAYSYSDDGAPAFTLSATNLPQLALQQVQDTQEVVASRGAHPQEGAEAHDSSIDVTNIGANNVFLKDLRKEQLRTVESKERIPIQAKEENVEKIETKNLVAVEPQSADKVITTGETENSEGILKTITEESQGTLVQDDPAVTADKPALRIALRSTEEELREPTEVKSQESVALTKKQSGSEETDKPALGIALTSSQEELKEGKQIIPQESVPTDTTDTSEKIMEPIGVFPLNYVYPHTIFEHAPLPYSIYTIP